MANPSCANCYYSTYQEDYYGNEHCWCELDERNPVEVNELSICEDYEPGPGMTERVEEECRCAGTSWFNRAACEYCHGRGYVVKLVLK